MAETHCPVCFTELEEREVAPCYDCGDDPAELEDLRAGRHTYDEVEHLGSRAVLCDFCQADFTSYDPTYFGRKRGERVGLGHGMELVRRLENPMPVRDKVCPQCKHRLAFLRFVMEARAASTA